MNINKACSIGILALLSAGNILFVHSEVWNAKAGTHLDMAAWNSSAYQVEAVSQLKDGGYIVNSSAAGFQSDIQIAVTFDAAGEVIQQVEVISQGETDGIGTKVTEESFLEQFAGLQAPVGLNGKKITVISPGTGEVWGAASAPADTAAAVQTDNRSNPERWNAEDQSPEAQAVRNLYRAGLLTSALEKQPLTTARADANPEQQASDRLAEAGLTTSTDHNYSSSRDQPPERIAAEKLEQAGLTVSAEADTIVTETAVTSGNLSEVDAVVGATVSSAALIQAVDQAYFFMQEQVLRE